jgi:hypothetical protein
MTETTRAMDKIDWKMTPVVLGLTFLSISPGISGANVDITTLDTPTQIRGYVETLAIGVAATYLTKSWWPLVGPVAYTIFDNVWNNSHKATVE